MLTKCVSEVPLKTGRLGFWVPPPHPGRVWAGCYTTCVRGGEESEGPCTHYPEVRLCRFHEQATSSRVSIRRIQKWTQRRPHFIAFAFVAKSFDSMSAPSERLQRFVRYFILRVASAAIALAIVWASLVVIGLMVKLLGLVSRWGASAFCSRLRALP